MDKKFIFASDDNNLYDIFYEKKIPFSPELSRFPTLSTINSKTDFDFALRMWKKQIKEKTNDVVIPLPLSLSVYEPEVAYMPSVSPHNNPKDNMNNDSDSMILSSKYFDYRNNPPLPITFPELFDIIIEDNPLNNGKCTFSQNVVHVKNQKPISINIYAQDEKKWGSSLIPQEPPPDLFDTYESYKKSLKNWASLQNENSSLLHPSDFVSLIGIVHSENDNYKNANKSNLRKNEVKSFKSVSSQYKIFDEKEFLNIKSKKTPPSPLLKQLFSLTYKNVKNTNSLSSIKYSNQDQSSKSLASILPFKVPFTESALINKVDEIVSSNTESSRIIHLLKSYKIIIDPYIDKMFINNIASIKMNLLIDLSANQTAALLKSFTPKQYDELISSFPFFLHQLHVIQSNRVRCRFFIIISNILENRPKLISTFFADVQTLSNVASLIADFSFVDNRIYTYDGNTFESTDAEASSNSKNVNNRRKSLTSSSSIPSSNDFVNLNATMTPRKSSASKSIDVKKTMDDLLFFLFANQLLKVLLAFVEKYQPKNRNLLLQINAQTMTFSKFIDISLSEKIGDIETAFLNPTPKNCVIFHFLCDYNPISLSKIFQKNLFYLFLGKVKLSPVCCHFFGEMCGHVLRIPKLRNLFFLQFLHLHCWLSSKSIMMTIVPTCNFLASLIQQESESTNDVTVDEIFTAFTNASQLVLFSPSSSLNLISSIISFLVKVKPKAATSTGASASSSNAASSAPSNTGGTSTHSNAYSNTAHSTNAHSNATHSNAYVTNAHANASHNSNTHTNANKSNVPGTNSNNAHNTNANKSNALGTNSNSAHITNANKSNAPGTNSNNAHNTNANKSNAPGTNSNSAHNTNANKSNAPGTHSNSAHNNTTHISNTQSASSARGASIRNSGSRGNVSGSGSYNSIHPSPTMIARTNPSAASSAPSKNAIVITSSSNAGPSSSSVSSTNVCVSMDSASAMYAHIRESLLALFREPRLRPAHIFTLYKLMIKMISTYKSDNKTFVERYLLTVVFKNMRSQNETVAVASWDTFREIFFDANFQFLRDSQPIKTQLSIVSSSRKNLSPPVLIEILFLALGVPNNCFSFSSSSYGNENVSKKKKPRRSINSLFDTLEGIIIPGVNPREIYEEVLKHYNEGHLKYFKNEVITLKVMMPTFKLRKRTISCV